MIPSTSWRRHGPRALTINLLLPLAACAAACGGADADSEPENVAEVEAPIADPTPVAGGQLLAMVQVSVDGWSCSGSLLDSRTVLTAAHCFCTVSWVGGNVCSTDATVTFRADATAGTTEKTITGTATVDLEYNPSWTEAQIEHDFAIIKLDEHAPVKVKPFVVQKNPAPNGSTVMIAGYGDTGSGCNVPSTSPNFDFVSISGYEDGHDIIRFDDTVICPGDSGGPVLDTTGTHLLGVHSMHSWTGATKSDTTSGEFDWIKDRMCFSSATNACDGNGDVCNCAQGTNILWQANNGQLAMWFMEGGTIEAQTYPGLVGSDWQIQGTGDFDGDGESDILWRHSQGQVAIWFMVGGANVGQAYPGGQDPSLFWKIKGVGDFDGDGVSDILWRDANGQLAIWFAGDNNQAAFPSYHDQGGPVGLGWKVSGVGDFDGDGHADILWRHTNGQVAIWSLDGASMVGEAYPGGADPSAFWKIQGVADFDGDLHADILWRDSQGHLAIWFEGQQTFDSPSHQNAGGTVDASWLLQGVGDFDHDGRADLLWRHTSGQLAIWLLDGARFVGDLYPGAPDNGWQIKGLTHD